MNALILLGARPALVDPGPNTRDARDALVAGLAGVGLAVDDISVLIVTHTHLDHMGLAAWVQGASGATIACHPLAVEALTDFAAEWPRRVALLRRAARAAGAPPDVVREMLEIQVDRSSLSESAPTAAVRPCRDGGRLRAGGADWSVLHTPGHAADHLALVHRPSGSLVGGDLLLRHMPSLPSLEGRRPDGSRPRTLADLVASLRRIGRLGLTIAWPGHGSPVRAHRILIARRLAETRALVVASRSALRREELTPYELAEKLALDVSAEALPTALGMVYAAGGWLGDRGIAATRTVDGVVRLSAPADRVT